MGVWIGALLTYGLVLAPRASRIFITAAAAAGIGQLAEEAFGTLHQLRKKGVVVTTGAGSAAEASACPTCGLPSEPGGRRDEAA